LLTLEVCTLLKVASEYILEYHQGEALEPVMVVARNHAGWRGVSGIDP
jgi:hypothetical protein